MDVINFEKYEIKNIPVYVYKTNNFPTISFRLYFFDELKKENITKTDILLRVLVNSSKKYNTKKKRTTRLDDLYSMNWAIDSNTWYKKRYISTGFQIIDSDYIEDDNRDYIKEGIETWKDLFFNLDIKHNGFDKKKVEECKYRAYMALKDEKDDRMAMAYQDLMDTACPDEVISYHMSGYEEELEGITPTNLYEYYKEFLQNSEKMMLIVGDFDFKKYEKELNDFIPDGLNVAKDESPISYSASKEVEEVKEIIRHDEVQQAQLFMLYRVEKVNSYKERVAYQIFNRMFGGYYNSSLMSKIRTENSLTYSIGSWLSISDGLMCIDSKIDEGDYEVVVSMIKDILKEYQEGNIDLELMEFVKEKVIDSLITTFDTKGSIIDCFQSNYIANREKLINEGINSIVEERIKVIKEISKEDIIFASKRVTLDTIYLLRSEEKDEKTS